MANLQCAAKLVGPTAWVLTGFTVATNGAVADAQVCILPTKRVSVDTMSGGGVPTPGGASATF